MTDKRFLLAFIVAGLVAASCGGDDQPGATPSATEVVSPTATETAAPSPTASATPKPSATPAAGATTSPTEPSLLPELESIVDIILTWDVASLRANIRPVWTPCDAEPEPQTWEIQCPEGVAEGTKIPYIRAMACEVVREQEARGGLEGSLQDYVAEERALYAVVRESGDELYLRWVPLGSYSVIVRQTIRDRLGNDFDWGIAFQVADGQIVGIRFGCGFSPEKYLEGVEESQILVGPIATPTIAAESPTESVLPSELEEIVDVILAADDVDTLRQTFRLVPTPCYAQPTPHSWQIKCPDGVEEGTEIPYFRATACEIVAEEEARGGLEGSLQDYVAEERALYAVVRESGDELYNPWIPRGTFAVIVRQTIRDRLGNDFDWGRAFQVADGQIVGIRFGCGFSPEKYLEGVEESQILVGPIAN